MTYLIITCIPAYQGLLGPVPPKVTIHELEAEDVQAAVVKVRAPLGGDVKIVALEHVTTVRAAIVNEIERAT
ncbi:MAG: hypothetical protein LC798_15510 [Chloroflexi bacterium]|nr:hypothetical protein [Chloroflexota bacterium]